MGLFDAGNAFDSGGFRVSPLPLMTSSGGSIGDMGVSRAKKPEATKIEDTATEKSTQSNTNTTSTGSTTGTNFLNTSNITQANEAGNEARNLQNVSDPILNAINNFIPGIGNNSTLRAVDSGREQQIQTILNAIQNFDAGAIQRGAQSQVAGLNRQLLEDVLPQVTGAVEASGSSNNALGALLAQDAASRTAEAGGRVMEEARANAAQEFNNLLQSATQQLQQGSATADTFADLINSAKGTVEQGNVANIQAGGSTTAGGQAGGSTTQEQGATTSTGSEEVRATGNSNTYDAAVADAIGSKGGGEADRLAKLALLQSSLSPFQTLQDLTLNTMRPGTSSSSRNTSQDINRLAVMLGL